MIHLPHRGRIQPYARSLVVLFCMSCLLASPLFLSEGAEAAYPGKNDRIAFEHDSKILTMTSSGDDEKDLVGPSNPVYGFTPAYSPDGQRIAYASSGDIYVRYASGGGLVTRLTTSPQWDSNPTWSPNGKKIAWERRTSNTGPSSSAEIWLMNVQDSDSDGNGDSATQLTVNSVYDGNPAFSSRGQIAFESNQGGGPNVDIYVMDPVPNASAVAWPTTPNGANVEPTWSPDGFLLAYAHYGTNYDIYVANLDGPIARLSNDVGHDIAPAFSPDGTRIAFASNRTGSTVASTYEIYSMAPVDANGDLNGDDLQRLTDNSVIDTKPDWQPIPRPPNDNFVNAQALEGDIVHENGTTLAATTEPGEPDHDVEWPRAHSVWYSWRALGSGLTTIDTCVSDIDSVLAIYTGRELTALNLVSRDNNGCYDFGPNVWGSRITFDAVAGRTYRIAVDDAGGAREKNFTLTISGQPNEPPVINTVRPVPGTTIADHTPEIRAQVKDSATDLVGEDMGLWLNGNRKNGFTYNDATNRLIFTPNRLNVGIHRVRIVATDAQGLQTTKRWRFTIQ